MKDEHTDSNSLPDDVLTSHEALFYACKELMVETGFHSVDNDHPSSSSSNTFSASYYWENAPHVSVRLIGVILGKFLNVFGTLEPGPDFVASSYQLDCSIIQATHLRDISSIHQMLPHLSRTFKDKIAFPLLSSIERVAGLPASFGFSKLPREIKIAILRNLPAPDLARLSCVCAELNELASEPILWKNALFRDFPRVIVPNSDTINWKELYKKEYLEEKKRKKERQLLSQIFNSPARPVRNFIEWPEASWDPDLDPFPASPRLDFLLNPLPSPFLPRMDPARFFDFHPHL